MPGAIVRANRSRISVRLRWIAGTRMCDDQSPSSCRISSAKSVSSACTPASARASFRRISSVVSDFTFTTSVAPCPRATSATIALASAASRAQCTCPPAASTAASNWSRYRSRFASSSCLIALPDSRSSSQSGSSATTRARFARIVSVAWRRFVRSCVFASSTRAASGKLVISTRGSRRGGVPGRSSLAATARRRSGGGTSCRRPRNTALRIARSHRTCRRASRSRCLRS